MVCPLLFFAAGVAGSRPSRPAGTDTIIGSAQVNKAYEYWAGVKAGGLKGEFHEAAQSLSKLGQQNVRTLRGWANSKGWVKQIGEGPEVWGVKNPDGSFSWRLKIKPVAGTRDGLGSGSQQPRFDARLDGQGTYVNPFTGQTGGRAVGTHLPLEQSWR